MDWSTIKVSLDDCICSIQFNRPEANNTINAVMVEECSKAIDLYQEETKIMVLEGLPDVFCFGADFQDGYTAKKASEKLEYSPEALYDLWMRMANGPYVTISHVRGQANAGGMGFVAASDIVISDPKAVFSLSEMLFGLYPAMVLPFLIRKIGFQKANYLTLMTKPISAQQAFDWGLVDIYGEKSDYLLKKHLSRLKILPKEGILNYKKYRTSLDDILGECKEKAISANRDIFSNPYNIKLIRQFVEKQIYPWEGS